ncbi:MAG: TRAP transporter small permease [Thalassospira sp.]|jgi:TRAP-type C4-dicarboxylate transport system permease small subunit|uniref:TRAP transporter small permease protein n=2 Tax=Thalassospira tepidiphila TaxID=393657 RepID=A0A853KVK3_9PROT|nr:tripartite ATP-independent periplasmic transporter DctQ [Thalassospira profundimaris WP0211]KXJ50334.1 MAG: C4-dicarboxylate ABC transporter permease [Thalassospira sp. Nap_22]MBE70209.1 TRAP transporter small permease [Thalassospira sp.]OAZ07857.1 C4-dicarboxylate ABC transporter permease [Thalassospira tepidiphila MCCC 1A03514]|tara:strand:- start:55 stop:522 length:468 start_codon:yes stop_codon:yes gene_type:complete
MEIELMLKRIEFACGGILLVAVVILVAVASVARAMGSPIIWSVEMAQLIFAWLCMLAADIAMQEDRHFGLQILREILSKRASAWVEIINILVIIGFLAFLLNYAWTNMILMHPRLVGAAQINASYIHASMVVGILLMIRTMVAQLIRRIRNREIN